MSEWCRSTGEMPEDSSPDQNWNELVEDLCDAARWFAAPGMAAEAYRDCLIVFSARSVKRSGYSLLSQISGRTVWLYVCDARDGTCFATLKTNPTTEFVTIQ